MRVFGRKSFGWLVRDRDGLGVGKDKGGGCRGLGGNQGESWANGRGFVGEIFDGYPK